MLKTRPVGRDGMVVVWGQPAGWKTMVQLAVWIGAAGAGAVDRVAGGFGGRVVRGGEDDVAVKEDVARDDDTTVARADVVAGDDASAPLTQLETSATWYVD